MKQKNLSEDDLDKLLTHLSESVKGPTGKYTAGETYPDVGKKIFPETTRRFPLFKYAAAASIVLLVSLSAYFYMESQPELILAATTDHLQEVILPDGSRVTLNHYSRLEYPSKFDKEKRNVTLSGEAYFDVARDTSHPFIVNVDKVNIEVLGTQFNVQSYPADAYVKTTLLEGSVAVSNTLNDNITILQPYESAIFSKETGSMDKRTDTAAVDEISWREGKLIFNDKTLQEITEDLSNYFNRKIEINSQPLKAYKLTAWFEHGETLEEILNILQPAAGFNWHDENSTITISFYIN